ncbi:DUF4838 domain-containing protein [Paenibacillus eucommiae]|uniref:SLH domain-containing protein n=1 Tax=Paenibacillus eucommiae TaxID=1355755 RepID=A0ABS4J449_9BACL|nr:DUF4838 domain-containing protein [Paenibacillus eucommiae]MBP1994060.1 hypothetical protein [Paenibacillus eucommiae]
MKGSKLGSTAFRVLLSICVILSTLGLTSGQAATAYSAAASVQTAPVQTEKLTGTDIQGHWAQAQLTKWLEAGLLQGYTNGQVAPDLQIARGEMVALINRSFGFTAQKDIQFTDLTAADWQYEDVSIAVNEGYLQGYEDGTARVQGKISRQEAAVMLGAILAPYLNKLSAAEAPAFMDDAEIADWSHQAVQLIAGFKIMIGYKDGSFRPLTAMTRAEAVTLLDRALTFVHAQDAVERSFGEPGVYGLEEDQTETIHGDVVISSKAVTLRNMIIKGQLTLTDGIGEGDVRLDRVKVEGQTTINGGGTHSVYIRDSQLGNVIIDKKLSPVRVVLEGNTTIGAVSIHSAATLEHAAVVSGGGVHSVQVSASLPAGSKVILNGQFDRVEVEASDARIELLHGVINKLVIKSQASGTTLVTEQDTTIIWLVVEAILHVLGTGTIEKATLSEGAKGSTFESQPLSLEGAATISSGSPPSTGAPATNPPEQSDNAKIVSHTAVNGAITVFFDKLPADEPQQSDFIIKQQIAGELELTIAPNKVIWHASNNKAVLKIASIVLKPEEQQVTYRISYKGQTAVDVAPLVVPAGLLLVEQGQAHAVIVVAAATGATVEAAELLAAYVERSTTAELPIIPQTELDANEQLYSDLAKIYIGTSHPGDELYLESQLAAMKEDSFIIDSKAGAITIVGTTVQGMEYGVYEFLERYVGVRWLMPGEDGEDVPQHPDLFVPIQEVQEEPVYLSRVMWPLQYYNQVGSNPTQHEWGVRNRLRVQNIGYEHNVWRFFPTSQAYLNMHPDYFSQKNGVPYIPVVNWGWQPCYSNPETAQVAAAWIINYFNANPNEPSMSLAVNDNGTFCEENPAHGNYTSQKNSLGLTDMSDIYYTWVNDVVERVLAAENGKFKDKWFGILAYQEVYDPPSFQLHERVVPYLTKDRMTWNDSGVLAKDVAIMQAWEQKAANIGLYDYTYGTPYTVPRVYFNILADIFKYGEQHQANAYFTEMAPNWGEGPKAWLMTKLLWNPDQDIDVLLDDWYTRAVGAEAAPYLQAYYEHWNDFWENRIKETSWFNGRKNTTYLNFSSASYLSIVGEEEIRQSRLWLETALDKAVTAKEKSRAALLLRAFEYYEASAISYPKSVAPLQTAADALILLEQAVNFEEKMTYAKKRQTLVEQFKNDPILVHTPLFEMNRTGMLWSGINAEAFWALVAYLKDHEPSSGPVHQKAVELAAQGETPMIRNYAQLLLKAVVDGPNNLNSSFEEATENDNGKVTAKYWDANIVNYGKFDKKTGLAASGDSSVVVKDFYFGDINQTMPGQSGLAIARLKYFVSNDIASVGDIWLELNLLDEQGHKLATFKSDQQPFYTSMGRWQTIQIMDVVPSKVNGIPVKGIRMSATVNGFFEGGTLYLDDFEFYQADDPGEVPLLTAVEAENGTLRIVFNEEPAQVPQIEDFSVEQLDGTGVITPTYIEWDAATRTASLAIPSIAQLAWEQSVEYEITYKEDFIRSTPLVIGRLPGYTSVLANSSFEDWTAGKPDGWRLWGEGFTRADTIKRSGQASLTVNGLSAAQIQAGGGGPFQGIVLEPGQYVGAFHYRTAAQTEGTIGFSLVFKNAQGTNIGSVPVPVQQGATSGGKWVTFSTEFEVMSHYNGVPMASAELLIHIKNFKTGERLYLDDIELIRKDDVPVPVPVSAEAANGELLVVFNTAPEQTPAIADFAISNTHNGQTVIPAGVNWDAATLTATVTIPSIAPLPWEQYAAYEIGYGSAPVLQTNLITVGRLAGYTSVLANSSFEHWTNGKADGWSYWGEGFTRSDSLKRSGLSSMTINGLSAAQIQAGGGGPFQRIVLEPGHYVGVLHYLTSAQTEGTVSYYIVFKNAQGTNIGSVPAPVQQGSASGGQWVTYSTEFEVMSHYNGVPMASAELLIHIRNFKVGERLYLDDIELIRQD